MSAQAEASLARLIADSGGFWEYLEDPRGQVVWVSPACEAVTGHRPEEFLRDPGLILAIMLPEDRPLFASHTSSCRRSERSGDTYFRILRDDGDVRWIAHRCKPVFFPGETTPGRCSSNQDVTDLKTSEERFRSLFDTMLNGLAHCEMLFEDGKPADFVYLEVNRAFGELTGLRDVVGRRVADVIPGVREANPELFEIYGRVAMTGIPERFETFVPRLDIWFSVSAYSPRMGHFVAVFDNITERKRAETRLRELNETLEQRVRERTTECEERAVQLWALTSRLTQAELMERERLAGVLHDHLQQILVAAKFNLDLLKGDTTGPDREALTRKVDELLSASIAECRSLTVGLSPPVLRESGLAAALGWLARRMEEQHGLRSDLDVVDFPGPADAGMKIFLFDAVRELLFNVVKHAGTREAKVTLAPDDGHLLIRVEDRGKGFDREAARHRRGESEAFGLFSIQQRLEMFGGAFDVDSGPGQGTRVTLRAPVKPGPVETGPSVELPESPVPDEESRPRRTPSRSGRIRVVIADDHRILRQGLIAVLKVDPNIDVVGEAADGVEAVELARSLSPDVIVMDVTMPRMNGIEATRKISAELPRIRIVGLSMHEDEAIVASMREAGAADFVTKGGRSDTLVAAIQAAARDGIGL